VTEEFIHFKQIHEAGLLGRTADEIGEAVIKAFEDEIPLIMRRNGFEPSF
jgi:hypothetical protein